MIVMTLSIVTLIVMINDSYAQVWRDSPSHGSSCRPFVHCESSSRGWRSSSPTLSLSSTSSSSSLSLLSTLPPTWSSVKYHHITGLVEEDTISRQSSCPSPTMIGALHGRDVVLRSATVDVIILHCHLHNVMVGTLHSSNRLYCWAQNKQKNN